MRAEKRGGKLDEDQERLVLLDPRFAALQHIQLEAWFRV